MIFQLLEAEKAHYPVRVLCEVLGVSRSGFYAWKTRPPTARSASDEQLAVEIAATHAKSTRRYGSPRIHRALRKRGIRVGKKRIARLMRANGIVGRRKRGSGSPRTPTIRTRSRRTWWPATSLLRGDVTYIATSEGWAYLAVLLDLFSRRVVGQRHTVSSGWPEAGGS